MRSMNHFALASLVTLALPLLGHADQIVVKMGTVAPEDTPWAYLAGKIRRASATGSDGPRKTTIS